MNINAISPLDGRYAKKVAPLAEYFSEKALMKARCIVECWFLLALDDLGIFDPLTDDEKARIETVIIDFQEEDYLAIKGIEEKTKHDVKSCEIYLQEALQLSDPNMIHFGLTSEDVNNLAYAFLLREYRNNVQIPHLATMMDRLVILIEEWKEIPFPSRTHGQKASPSTAGKELSVFLNRMTLVYEELKKMEFAGKINGAVGNYSAMLSAAPDVDWHLFAEQFLAKHGFRHNIATTQIEDHDSWAKYFNLTRQLNNIIIDLDVDCWLYISKDLFFEKVQKDEVGSSTMPHKVNPINFENSEGNMMLSNAILGFLSDKLCRSRMQRDLSDSTVERNFGVALGYAHMAISETVRGLNKLQINEVQCLEELKNSPELLAEPIQTILRLAKVEDPYNLLKQATRGQKPDMKMLMDLVDTLNIADKFKEAIRALEPETYIGDAHRIADLVISSYKSVR